MSAAVDFRQARAGLLFDISPLWRQPELRWPALASHYTVVLVETAGGSGNLPRTMGQAPSELYFGCPSEAALAAVPARARGQVLRFTDEFVGLAGHDRELLLFQLFHRASGGPVRVPAEQAVDLALLVAGMKRQATGEQLLRDALLRSYLKTLLLFCTRLSQQQGGHARPLVQPGLFGRFQQLLEGHYTRWKSVAEYAAHLHVTANHLSTSIKKETGQPAGEHIRRRIVLEAKRLASLSDAPLKEVAYQLGFEDASHFSKLFKRSTGTTFSDFKKQVQARYRAPTSELVLA